MNRIRTKQYFFLIFFVFLFIPAGFSNNSYHNVKGKTSAFTPYQFVTYGDTQVDYADNSGHITVANLINQTDAEFCIHTGDMVNWGGDQSDWNKYYHPVVSQYITIPIYYSIGNHEYYTDEYYVYDDDLSTTLTNVNFPNNMTYYSFDSPQNDTHFIALNSELYFFPGHILEAKAQDAWLEVELAANINRRLVVFFHRPLWSIWTRWEEYAYLRSKWHALFVKYGVDLVVNGHDHLFYTTVRDGINYIVSGAGTSALRDPDLSIYTLKPEDYFFKDNHICLIEATESGFKIDVIVSNGTIIYSFSVDAPLEDSIPPKIVSVPADITVENGGGGTVISWTAEDSFADHYWIYQNNEIIESENWDNDICINYVLEGLEVGDHNFTVAVVDISRNIAVDTVIVTVKTAAPPDPSTPFVFEFLGEKEMDQISSIDGVGDVNNDGFDDFIIGSDFNGERGFYSGKTYLLLGRPTKQWTTFDLSQANVSFIAEEVNDVAGRGVGVGDVNNDGFDDFIISAYENDEWGVNTGQTYLILGRETWPSDKLSLSHANASFYGEGAASSALHVTGDLSGWVLTGVGDVNADGFDDFAIAAAWHNQPSVGVYTGKTYIIFGRSSELWKMDVSLSEANASFHGIKSQARAGMSISGAGDINNDGFNDLIIGGLTQDEGYYARQNFVILGRPTSQWKLNVPLSEANITFTGKTYETSEYYFDALQGIFQLSGIGDVNNDGYSDIAIGDMFSNEGGKEAGQAYIFLGRPTDQWSDTYSYSQADSSFIGENDYDWAGSQISAAGDVNNDSYDDFMIASTAVTWFREQSSGYEVYLILGKPTIEWKKIYSLSEVDCTFTSGIEGDGFGLFHSGVGDVNNDGYDDIIIGAWLDNEQAYRAGKAYLYLQPVEHPFETTTLSTTPTLTPTTTSSTLSTTTTVISETSPFLPEYLPLILMIIIVTRKRRGKSSLSFSIRK
ncbi:MAG: metallophosphoesterase, partial [Promethearchaeota archaeon]